MNDKSYIAHKKKLHTKTRMFTAPDAQVHTCRFSHAKVTKDVHTNKIHNTPTLHLHPTQKKYSYIVIKCS